VVQAQHQPPAGLLGIDNEAVELLRVDELGVWMSAGQRPQVSVEAVQAHNHVVEVAVNEEVTPVPLRFGQWLEDMTKLTEAVRERGNEYTSLLAHFAGCLEFGLRLVDPDEPAEAQEVHSQPSTGTEYMHALRDSSKLAERKQAEIEAVGASVRELLGDIIRDERVESARTRHAVLTLSHLVAREHFDEYRERARRVRTLFPALRLLLTGPWPPYSFAV
jgi:hypothetical protein